MAGRRGPGSNQHRDKPPERPRPAVAAGEQTDYARQVARAGALAPPDRIRGMLSGRDLSGRDLRDLEFVGVPRLHQVRFDRSDLTGHPGVVGTFTHCSFVEVSAPSANLDGFHVATRFTGSALPLATLPSATDSEFDDVNAELAVGPRRNFDYTRWPGARLRGARFSGSTFRSADLSRAIDVDLAVFRGCVYDADTAFPSGYEPAAHGWLYVPLTSGEQGDLAELRAAAEAGELSSYSEDG